MKWLDTLKMLAPVLLALTPAAPIAPFVQAGIEAAERMNGASSADKLAHAKQIATLSIAATNAQAGHALIDPTISDEAINSGINAVIQTVNLFHKKA